MSERDDIYLLFSALSKNEQRDFLTLLLKEFNSLLSQQHQAEAAEPEAGQTQECFEEAE